MAILDDLFGDDEDENFENSDAAKAMLSQFTGSSGPTVPPPQANGVHMPHTVAPGVPATQPVGYSVPHPSYFNHPPMQGMRMPQQQPPPQVSMGHVYPPSTSMQGRPPPQGVSMRQGAPGQHPGGLQPGQHHPGFPTVHQGGPSQQQQPGQQQLQKQMLAQIQALSKEQVQAKAAAAKKVVLEYVEKQKQMPGTKLSEQEQKQAQNARTFYQMCAFRLKELQGGASGSINGGAGGLKMGLTDLLKNRLPPAGYAQFNKLITLYKTGSVHKSDVMTQLAQLCGSHLWQEVLPLIQGSRSGSQPPSNAHPPPLARQGPLPPTANASMPSMPHPPSRQQTASPQLYLVAPDGPSESSGSVAPPPPEATLQRIGTKVVRDAFLSATSKVPPKPSPPLPTGGARESSPALRAESPDDPNAERGGSQEPKAGVVETDEEREERKRRQRQESNRKTTERRRKLREEEKERLRLHKENGMGVVPGSPADAVPEATVEGAASPASSSEDRPIAGMGGSSVNLAALGKGGTPPLGPRAGSVPPVKKPKAANKVNKGTPPTAGAKKLTKAKVKKPPGSAPSTILDGQGIKSETPEQTNAGAPANGALPAQPATNGDAPAQQAQPMSVPLTSASAPALKPTFTQAQAVPAAVAPGVNQAGVKRPAEDAPMGQAKPKKAKADGPPNPAGIPQLAAPTSVQNPQFLSGAKRPPPAAIGPASQKKQKEDDVTRLQDVTAVAGLDLEQEAQQSMALAGPIGDTSAYEEARLRIAEEEDKLFVNEALLRTRVASFAAKKGVRQVGDDVYRCLSMAVEDRLRGMLHGLTKMSKQRTDVRKGRFFTYAHYNTREEVLKIRSREAKIFAVREAKEQEELRQMLAKRGKGPLTDPELEKRRQDALKLKEKDEELKRKEAAMSTAMAALGKSNLAKWTANYGKGVAKGSAGASAKTPVGGAVHTTAPQEQLPSSVGSELQTAGPAGLPNQAANLGLAGVNPPAQTPVEASPTIEGEANTAPPANPAVPDQSPLEAPQSLPAMKVEHPISTSLLAENAAAVSNFEPDSKPFVDAIPPPTNSAMEAPSISPPKETQTIPPLPLPAVDAPPETAALPLDIPPAATISIVEPNLTDPPPGTPADVAPPQELQVSDSNQDSGSNANSVVVKLPEGLPSAEPVVQSTDKRSSAIEQAGPLDLGSSESTGPEEPSKKEEAELTNGAIQNGQSAAEAIDVEFVTRRGQESANGAEVPEMEEVDAKFSDGPANEGNAMSAREGLRGEGEGLEKEASYSDGAKSGQGPTSAMEVDVADIQKDEQQGKELEAAGNEMEKARDEKEGGEGARDRSVVGEAREGGEEARDTELGRQEGGDEEMREAGKEGLDGGAQREAQTEGSLDVEATGRPSSDNTGIEGARNNADNGRTGKSVRNVDGEEQVTLLAGPRIEPRKQKGLSLPAFAPPKPPEKRKREPSMPDETEAEPSIDPALQPRSFSLARRRVTNVLPPREGDMGPQTRAVTLKDLIAVLEKEPQMAKSALLYKLYCRTQRDQGKAARS